MPLIKNNILARSRLIIQRSGLSLVSKLSLKIVFVEASVILLIGLFAYASFSKLLEYDYFISQISENPILKSSANWLAWFIPAVELLTCVLLLVPRIRLKGLYLSFGLMLAFTGYIYYILTLSETIPCSCGGILSQLDWESHLFFNLFFVAIALISITIEKRSKRV